MADLYPVEVYPKGVAHDLSDVQVVFHGVNKSGSFAMASALREAYQAADRAGEFHSHYGSKTPTPLYVEEVERSPGRGFFVAHYLYGALRPHPRRILITQFRHPLPRILSCYQWLRNKYERKNKTLQGFPTLQEFVVAGKGKAHSQIVQFGIGFGAERSARIKRMSPRDIYDNACEAIEREVYCLGLAEYFEESIFLFAHLCGLPAVLPWIRDNRNPGRPLADEVDSDTADMIREIYRYDFDLYEWAVKRFREQNQQFDFGLSLTRYKHACSAQYKDRILTP